MYRAYDQSAERWEPLSEHMAKLGIAVEAVSSFQEALSEADMGIVATTESEPYVTAAEFKAWLTVYECLAHGPHF